MDRGATGNESGVARIECPATRTRKHDHGTIDKVVAARRAGPFAAVRAFPPRHAIRREPGGRDFLDRTSRRRPTSKAVDSLGVARCGPTRTTSTRKFAAIWP